ncbi:cupredoxin domain-containing protein [Candidatus Nitrospira bockiana]
MPKGPALRGAILIACVAAAIVLPSYARTQPPGSQPPFSVPLDPDGVQRATIILDSYSYDPPHLIVQAGKPVELVLRSVTTLTPHNFILKEPQAGLVVEADVGAGKTMTVRFTPTEPGVYPFYCDKKLLFFPSHRAKGMEGLLEVR